jgi:hypothetical protein
MQIFEEQFLGMSLQSQKLQNDGGKMKLLKVVIRVAHASKTMFLNVTVYVICDR